ncbi:MAG: SCP2 sterol-binding domain-containing protein [bacterium]|nr:SCP2 sterol-binding domain-containing protein [bacterium]
MKVEEGVSSEGAESVSDSFSADEVVERGDFQTAVVPAVPGGHHVAQPSGSAIVVSDDDGDDDDDDEDAVVVSGGDDSPEDLSEIYDLDKGERVDSSALVEEVLPWRARVETAKEFFQSEILYRYDIVEPEKQKILSGDYRFELKGYQGGIWTVSLKDGVQVVNRREPADVVFTMQQKDFLHMVNGEINPQLAILAGRVKITGDVRKALLVQEVLGPVSE